MGPTPNPSFVRDLRNLDRRLGIKWNGEHHVVTYDRGHGEPVNIYRVKGDDGGYRQPDQRDLAVIKGGDLSCGDTMKNRLQKLAYASECMRRDARRKAAENIRDMTKDDRTYLAQRFVQMTNQGKGNSAYRRVPHKPGKNVVMTA